MPRNKNNYKRWRKAYYASNVDLINETRRAWYAGLPKLWKVKRNAKTRTAYKAGDSVYHAARTLRYRRKLKSQVIEAYGGRCSCCSERHQEFLTLDHVKNDGKQHRVSLFGKNAGATMAIYRHVRDAGFPPDFTVLCFNCNIARSLFGTCPHKRKSLT